MPRGEDAFVGTLLEGRYRVGAKLADGGMGAVYSGTHVRIGRPVAIKKLHPALAHQEEMVRRFQQEAEAAAAIGHPHIVDVLDLGVADDGGAFLVMERLEGEDLGALIAREGPQPLGKVAHILCQVASALEATHARGIVHRDLKAENIFLTPRSEDPYFVKLLDFGVSKVRPASGGSDLHLTESGVALGTPYYMAPEQCHDSRGVDGRADVFALGVLLYRALTARYPFEADSYPRLVVKICTEAPTPIHAHRPELPPELGPILERLLAKDRSERFESAREVKAALAPWRAPPEALRAMASMAETAPWIPTVNGVGPSPPPSRRRRVSPKVLVPIVAFGLLAGGAMAWTRSPSPSRSGIDSLPLARAEEDESPRDTEAEAAPYGPAEDRVEREAEPADDLDRAEEPGSDDLRVARLRVVAVPLGQIFIDGVPVGERDVRRRLEPGVHRIEVEHAGRRVSRRVRLAPGERRTITLRP